VRHRGASFRSAPPAKHIAYLRWEGVFHDQTDGTLLGRDSDRTDAHNFTAAWEEHQHHFRFIVSPEDGAQRADFRAFTRDLMARLESDLGTRVDWAAIDHWNTDNPHLHIPVRGKAEDGHHLVISRDYFSRGFRARAEHLVELELGPRPAREVAHALAAEAQAERWTGLDRALRALADDYAGIADLRPSAPEPRDRTLRHPMISRAQVLERFGLTEQLAPAVWQQCIAGFVETRGRRLPSGAALVRDVSREVENRCMSRSRFYILRRDAHMAPSTERAESGRSLHPALATEVQSKQTFVFAA
jgi:type IV secretory pathway VirD2 relaxase